MGKRRRLTFDYQEVSLRRCDLGGSARMEKSWMEGMGRNVAEMLRNIRI